MDLLARSRLVEATERATIVAGMGQTATVWFERDDGARISWAGPFTMTEAQRRAYVADAREMIADLSTRETWPVSPSMRGVRIVSLEVVEPDDRVSFAWTAP